MTHVNEIRLVDTISVSVHIILVIKNVKTGSMSWI